MYLIPKSLMVAKTNPATMGMSSFKMDKDSNSGCDPKNIINPKNKAGIF